jgi:exopolysaccharide biosynthesis WecB/TagA/CpsF family protein
MNKIRFFGYEMAYDQQETIIDEVIRLSQSPHSSYVIITDVYGLVLSLESEPVKDTFLNSSLILTDSTVLQFHLGIASNTKPHKVSYGSAFMSKLLGFCAINDVSVGLIGCSNRQELANLCQNLEQNHQRLRITFFYCPPFSDADEYDYDFICDQCEKAEVDLLFVGVGAPKQNFVMDRISQKSDITLIGVGAAFDVLSGRAKAPPKIFHQNGLGWLYRVLSSPGRLSKRIWYYFKFIFAFYIRKRYQ